MFNKIPQDPMMLVSFVNMKLRNEYSSLDELCSDLNLNKNEIIEILLKAGFEYSQEEKQFR